MTPVTPPTGLSWDVLFAFIVSLVKVLLVGLLVLAVVGGGMFAIAVWLYHCAVDWALRKDKS